MCSSGHNLVSKIHPRCLSAFCVVEMKCKVLNVPSLFALMEVTSAGVLQAPVEFCLQFDDVV